MYAYYIFIANPQEDKKTVLVFLLHDMAELVPSIPLVALPSSRSCFFVFLAGVSSRNPFLSLFRSAAAAPMDQQQRGERDLSSVCVCVCVLSFTIE